MKRSEFRDRAALGAMRALIRRTGLVYDADVLAEIALRYADAMVEERQKRITRARVHWPRARVHWLDNAGPDFTLCGLTDPDSAGWPGRDRWSTERKAVTCEACLEMAVKRERAR